MRLEEIEEWPSTQAGIGLWKELRLL
jgi:hypothetical protein